jgi:alkylation response protein AidB-like acyl-CoA dehydrogenase
MFIRSTERDTSLDAFRRGVREFCQKELPEAVKRKQARGQHLEKHEYIDWLQRLGTRGWNTGKWPTAHGGLGWKPEQHIAFQEELGRAGAPPLMSFGPTMVGPVIYTFGNEEQKKQHLPAIIKGTLWWCQGYSEPGAGSDLAALKTRADRDGDDYIVNGQKIWTSTAHWADWMFALVRTDQDAKKKQEGISFILIDMKTPGITVRPIIGITLGHHLNEVFFDNVRVPIKNRIGEENKGWTYAKFLLANERVGTADMAKFERYLDLLKRLLRETKDGGRPLAENSLYTRRMAELEVGMAAVKALAADQLAAAREGGAPTLMGAAALKLKSTDLQQKILETLVEVLSRHGLAYQKASLEAGWNGELVGPEEQAGVLYEHLYRRAATIYGGSSEVQRNIIAKGALGL